MAAPSSRSVDTPDISAHRVIRRVARRYVSVLAAVAGLVVTDQAILQPMLVHMNAFAPTINAAGRQRMLSQRVTKAALVLKDPRDDAQQQVQLEELRTSLDRWTSDHEILVRGDRRAGIKPIDTTALKTEWDKLEPHYEAMVAAARTIIETPGDRALSPTAEAAVATLVEHESRFLSVMDRIVGLMEDEAARVVRTLRKSALAIAFLVVALLVGLGWFVVRPATRAIRSQIDSLGARVTARTAELRTTLTTLEQEIREREEAESRSQKLSAQLKHADRVSTMGHLTAGLAHELNQPLAAITNYLEACDVLLEEAASSDPFLDRIQELAGDAKQSALRAGQIVSRMRNYVRPNTTVPSPVRINQVIRDVVEFCRTEVATSNTEIVLILAALDHAVTADPVQIQQVLVNLVHNALQAMESSNSSTRRITFRTSDGDGHVRVDVIDTGPGFALIDTDRAFEPFCSTKPDGLGIGLSICRSIVEDHHGRIWADPSTEHGATVSFTLPLTATNASGTRTPTDCLCG